MSKYSKALETISNILNNLPSLHQGKEMDMNDLDLDHDGYEFEVVTIKELVDKEIPMKPIPDLFGYICKSCDNDIYVGSSTINNYCDVCGQKLDWSNE